MMFEYLEKFVGHNDLKGNYFIPLEQERIMKAEKELGQLFPNELRDFYKLIGTGRLSCGIDYPKMHADGIGNEILPPEIAVAFMHGDLLHDDSNHYMSEDMYEMLGPQDLPFFEICDSSRFLFMKLDSENENAVWALGDIKIEDSFEKFVWRLYHESPWFYDDVIDAHYGRIPGES